MKAVILAAGRGSRMGDLTSNKPKCLVEFAGKSLLAWQMAALKGGGIEDIGIVRGYMADKLLFNRITVFENLRWEKANMVVSLMCAKEWLNKETCIISYADIVYSPGTVTRLLEAKEDITITYDVNWLKLWRARFNNPLSDAETFRIDMEGRLVEIGNKPKDISEVKGQYMGLLKFSPTGWKLISNYLNGLIQEEIDCMDITSLLQRLVKNGIVINTVPIHENWYEVDSENDLTLYSSMVRQTNNKLW